MFFFSANYGQMDSLADDGSRKFLKYRLISRLVVVPFVAVYVPVYFYNVSLVAFIGYDVVMFFLVNAARFHLKHLIFPDVSYGVINCLKAL